MYGEIDFIFRWIRVVEGIEYLILWFKFSEMCAMYKEVARAPDFTKSQKKIVKKNLLTYRDSALFSYTG